MSRLLVIFAVLILATAQKINVHIVCHTHDDVGWLKTVDQYYTGNNNTIQHANVRFILDTVVAELAKDSTKKFTYVEQAFFQRWWREQDEATRNLTRTLAQNGQLSFVNGGWCMHDEAATHYVAMVDQTTLGHKLLLEEFGQAGVPTIGWQLDPFGHSATQAALLSADAGMDGLFFGRIDYQDLQKRNDNKECEFIWQGSPSLGSDAQVFAGLTGEYRGNYGPPGGLNFNVDSDDEMVQSNPKLTSYNLPSRLQDFINAATDLANRTRGSNVMFTMGSDFQYESAHNWYYNLDQLIKAAQADGRINAFYSTPAEYLAAKKKETGITWPKVDGDNADFFPYADGPSQFWTGYFTSRPALKRYVRANSAFLNAVRQVKSISSATNPSELEAFAEALGVSQHHDAVSGTAKQHVAFDYARRISGGEDAGESVLSAGLKTLLNSKADWTRCRRLNETVCTFIQQAQNGFTVAIWNPLGQSRTETIALPVPDSSYSVAGSSGKVPVQFYNAGESVTNYRRNTGEGKLMAAFQAFVPALGVATYTFTRSAAAPLAVELSAPAADTTIQNEYLSLSFNGITGHLSSITNKKSGTAITVDQSFCYYLSNKGDLKSGQRSGAYIFRPKTNTTCIPVNTGPATVISTVINGGVVQEVRQVFADWLTQTVRLKQGARHAEFEFTVGEIPFNPEDTKSKENEGREVVSRFSTSIKSAGELLTDSNGRDMLRRQRDYRPTWNLKQTEEVAGNYFPCNGAAAIRDSSAQLTVMVDASQGTGSIVDGQIEFMVHRRVLADDSRGVGEPLNETQFTTGYSDPQRGHGGDHYGPGLVVRGTHYVSLEPPATAAATWRPIMDAVFGRPQLAFSSAPAMAVSYLATPLPSNLQLMTLDTLSDNKLLLRLSHQFGINEDPNLSKPVSVDLSTLFAPSAFTITQATEVSLTNNQPKSAILSRRKEALQWKTETEAEKPHWWRKLEFDWTADSTVTLGPLEIKTFVLDISKAAVA